MTSDHQQHDTIELFHNALIQHGPLSNRVYLMKLKKADPKNLISKLESLAKENHYTKIFAKIPSEHASLFLQWGYEKEAVIPDFFIDYNEAFFLGRYFDSSRQTELNADKLDRIKDIALAKSHAFTPQKPLPDRTIIRQCTEDDAETMSSIYRTVFCSYPFPIDDPEYIIKTMHDNIVYFCVEKDGEILALSSAEMDVAQQNVEMTDFATIPEYRGKGLATKLLLHMEQNMLLRKMRTAYTIARAASPGMNVTFAKCGYTFAGRLKNNTNIAGTIESMNVWYKTLV